jgi:hypothetical protein
MKPDASECNVQSPECAKTHLQASGDRRKIFRLAIARHEGEKRGGDTRGGEDREEGDGRKGRADEGGN